MKFRVRRLGQIADNLRDLARRQPDEAEKYLDAHHAEWEELAEASPQNAADILEALEEEDAADLLTDLDAVQTAADVLDEMRPEAAADLLEELRPEAAAHLIEEMTVDQAADLIGALEADARAAVLDALEPETAAEVANLLAHPSDSAGGMMTTKIASLPVGITSGEAIEALRRLHDELGSNLSYVYVVDDAGLLEGVVSFRDLVFARPGTAMVDVMVHDPVAVALTTDREIVAELIQRYHLLAIPVTDDDRRLVGIVKVDIALEAVQEEASEDIAAMVGLGAEESVLTPITRSIVRRLPWIVFNLAIGLVIAVVVRAFEPTIEDTAILAAFMPMVALLGGNSGAQSLAVIIRAMAVGDLPATRARRAIRREVIVGSVNGAAVAVLSGLVGGLVAGDAEIGLIIAIAVFANLVIAGLAGSGIPVALRRLGLDPALASNILLTMVTDLVGFGGFLLTASLVL